MLFTDMLVCYSDELEGLDLYEKQEVFYGMENGLSFEDSLTLFQDTKLKEDDECLTNKNQ